MLNDKKYESRKGLLSNVWKILRMEMYNLCTLMWISILFNAFTTQEQVLMDKTVNIQKISNMFLIVTPQRKELLRKHTDSRWSIICLDV